MIDFEEIKKNPEKYREAIRKKRIPLNLDQLLAIAEERKNTKHEVDALRHERNKVTDEVKVGTNKEENIRRGRAIGTQLKTAEISLNDLNKTYDELTALVPGVPEEDVPEGETDEDNCETKRWGTPRKFDFEPKDHLELAAMHKMVNFEGARQIAGSRAYALTGTGALLEMAVLQFALQHVLKKGFTPVLPPLMVNENAMFGTGYFPLGEESAYHIAKDDLFLTGTSEVGTCAIHMNETFDEQALPLRLVGISPCFRREAGAAGRDTKGFYRVHQFQKVEQVVICSNGAGTSRVEHDALLKNAEEILQALELPFRVVAVCTGDMGLGQVRKHDIETWMPSRNAYGETHSCSTFYEFQARRLNMRYRDKEGKKHYVHTLNNTAIASPRILIPLLENHQNRDGTINIPKALQPFLCGKEILEPC
ncbi:MAG: serine--tRNA ligase [Cyanobacteria bacterium SZAS-4]|nr:serine--tRNA ligase [Cyanobacteria bacterium SZAS-4]